MPLSPAYIRDVAIRVDESFTLSNSPVGFTDLYQVPEEDTKKPSKYLGREEIRDKFLEFLRGPVKKGAFLVTGYRGMGKTSFVNHVLTEYSKKQKVVPIYMSMAQSRPREIDILKLLTSKLYDAYKKIPGGHYAECEKRQNAQKIGRLILVLLFASLIFPLMIFNNPEKIQSFLLTRHTFFPTYVEDGFARLQWMAYIVLALWAVGFLWIGGRLLYHRHRIRKISGEDSTLGTIRWLYQRCFAAIQKESSESKGISLNMISTITAGSSSKMNAALPIAQAKEIEYSLSLFLEKIRDEGICEFIFVFDELDKVDPAIAPSYLYEDSGAAGRNTDDSYQKDLRDRKQAIINIIAGLKNFLTTADARFIFIAGREMFDASLADIADRESSISSIFTYVFYVESFLKEKRGKAMSSVIEDYLSQVLFGPDAKTDTPPYKQVLSEFEMPGVIAEEQSRARGKLVFSLQSFVVYLTYRSSGSPKKLIKLMHEFIKVKEDGFKDTVLVAKKTTGKPHALYLYFHYYDQYRIGFINYLYRPFLVSYGSVFKLLSDNTVVSIPYLFDHLLKFHPYSFSVSNLELIPEVLSTNKTPMLRDHILQIVQYLSLNHIRETEIGLFDYKFYSRTYNEIVFISRIFEEESAAFNFSLDEAYLVKLHVGNKLKELRSTYEKFSPGGDNLQIFSITYLNGVLGDLHFFDQEYDDAIVAYSDAIRPINHLDTAKMNIRDFITLIRYKLKLGLCFEKIASYEEAIAFYSDSAQDAKRFILTQIARGKYMDPEMEKSLYLKRSQGSAAPEPEIFYSSTLSDLLQIINQCFLAKIIIEEKMGMEGITTAKVSQALGGFLTLAEAVGEHCGKNNLIIANMYSILGNLLYYKNSHYAEPNLPSMPYPHFESLRPVWVRYMKFFGTKENKDKKQSRKPLLALVFYLKALHEVFSDKEVATGLFDQLERDANPAYGILSSSFFGEAAGAEKFVGTHNKYIAILLSNIGDCLLSLFNDNEATPPHERNVLEYFFDLTKFEPYKEDAEVVFSFYLRPSSPDKLQLSDILHIYFLSGQYFRKVGRAVSSSLQYRKILRVLRLVLKYNDEAPSGQAENILRVLHDKLVHPILEIAGHNAAYADRPMVKKMEDIGIAKYDALGSISNHPDTREAIFLYTYVMIRAGVPLDKLGMDVLIHPYNSFSSQYTRIMEHDLYSKYCHRKLPKKPEDDGPAYGKLAVDYIFCLLSILRILKIYGIDYSLGFSYCAYTHLKLGRFLKKVEALKDREAVQRITKGVGDMLDDRENFVLPDKEYHFEMAMDFFHKAIRLHTAGTEYKTLIGGLVYLEDDINDNAYHFGAALDRYMMGQGIFDAYLKECRDELKDSLIRRHEAYTVVPTANETHPVTDPLPLS